MKYNIGDLIEVTITSVTPYGAFVKADYDYTGLIHISEITGNFINNIEEYFKIGNKVKAKIIGIDEEKKHLSLSTKGFVKDLSGKNILIEEGNGFENLKEKLPEWIDNTSKEIKNSE